MILPTTTVCTLFTIRQPVWGGGKRKVGLALNRISDHNEIKFLYRRKDGELSMPDSYYISGQKIRSLDFELQNVKGLTLVLVPFDQLEILTRGDKEREEELIEWLNKPGYAKTLEELKNQ